MLKRLQKTNPLFLAIILVIGLFLITVKSALAHTRVEIGPYVMIIGWENEPPIVGDRNFLVIDISKDGEPVREVEATLDLQVLYGGRVLSANLNPTATPGRYRVDMYPTVRGQYTVAFSGMIEDTAVDIQAEPEEVLPAAVLQFPESPPETTELQTEIADLSAQLQSARLMAIIGIVLGVIGTAVGAVSLLMKRAK